MRPDNLGSGGAAVELRAVSKRYGQVQALRDINISVEAGEFVALLGPSGSGKTTILMCIAGFEQPSDGAVRIGESDMTKVPVYRRDVGLVFQRYALFPHMTVAKNVGFPLEMRRLAARDRRRRVAEALELVKLDHLGDRLPSQLSGGQAQRVALARALVYRPAVLLMDEPLGALDRKLREYMQLEIRNIHRAVGTTFIYVTHDQSEALAMADRTIVMHNGAVQQIGTPEELYLKPQNLFVADFIGGTNFIDGRVARIDGNQVQVAVDGGRFVAAHLVEEGPGSAGADVRLAVRPECVRLEQERPTKGSSRLGICGVIEDSIFEGTHIAVLVRIGAHTQFKVYQPFPATVDDFKPGEQVTLTWSESDAHAFAPP